MKSGALLLRRNPFILLTLSFLFSLLVILGVTFQSAFAYHPGAHGTLVCTQCHLTTPDPVVDTADTVDFIAQPDGQLCAMCHTANLGIAAQALNEMNPVDTTTSVCSGYSYAYYSYWITLSDTLGYNMDHYYDETWGWDTCYLCHNPHDPAGGIPGTSNIRVDRSLGNGDMCYYCHQSTTQPFANQQIIQGFTREVNGINPEYALNKLPKILVFDSIPAPDADITDGLLTLTAALYHENDNLIFPYKYDDSGDPATNGRGFYLDVKFIDATETEYTPTFAIYTINSNPEVPAANVSEQMILNKLLTLYIGVTVLPSGTYTLSITPRFEGEIDCNTTPVDINDAGPPFEYQFTVAPINVTISAEDSELEPILAFTKIGKGRRVIKPTEEPFKVFRIHESDAQTTTITVTVTDQSDIPVPDYHITLAAGHLAVFGRHDHDGNAGETPRPEGKFHYDSGDDGIPDAWGSSVDLVTDADGVCTITYRTSGIGGVDRIVATRQGSTEELAASEITLQANGIMPYQMLWDYFMPYVLVGSTPRHWENHWGTQQTYSELFEIARQFNIDYPSIKLRFNDISLRNGGVFDIMTDNVTLTEVVPAYSEHYNVGDILNRNWHPPHIEHRKGDNCDVGRYALKNGNKELLTDDEWVDLQSLIFDVTGTWAEPEGNHLHARF